ncbi:MAG: preprotein translocase subunit SecA [Candidatus Staskawiczbacteria bacterium RIFOXYB1_FULL_37_44]|uniref:Protein translocase subunit SecA n=1 Tax=Candidatus Staskawiczbacteria bacterium RIFOXYB1_FULL_37_44 TaxID=1802223 RepID=A0A1G2IW36_9BACT|nr:MAG: preprotein translocase subunit SecA [Candidatus Staskawiczbacteria bacterium RIFOXYB1_FULL_37_44]OGZ83281.1 MAG: preprotein translocase subunit SecA [Candidatus Staskawiczbacteria bacterium RIFOXYC1_FULL_37_52]OGZ87773.1 MAG: preprotein translocase subunit SecA [Candidatus Staskawiczbacteria bacterium RIFOXYC2_FULL_37_19]OGZ89405.1 MAG: preprotein translocase subunit SecA [Candidatus Staskawiczbacteria bacterium RIFOXYD1_FULL_37_110]
MSILSKFFGDPNEKFIKSLAPIVEKINSFSVKGLPASGWELKKKTLEFKERLTKGETLDEILPEAFACAREAGKRTLNQRHFDAQMIGGIVLHQGKIAEMKTGEGKTLAATLPAYLNALEGKGVHIVTVNDYLAKRDMVWMGQIYEALGMSVGCITNESGYIYDPKYGSEIRNSKFEIRNDGELDKKRDELGGFKVVQEFLKPCSKKESYAADITYGTNNEFGFDYLRDNMAYEKNQEVQRSAGGGSAFGGNFVIVDEVDSILIDEARVPLIISGQAEDATEKYYTFAKVISTLEKISDFELDEKMKAVNFTEAGQNKIVKKLGFDPWLDNDITTTHQLESALKAKALFLKDRDYTVKNGEILIIDEFTGRILPGRRWSGGLHQAVEAKEGVVVQPESITMATITFQNYFRMYKKLAGMTGTALTSAEEFDKVYKLEVVAIPPNKAMARQDLADKIFKTEAGKFTAVIKEIEELNKKGQPILVGTRSVERNEYLGKLLQTKGIAHNILNAKNHEREGEIIAQAGKRGAVTIATNMAGRGVDIILGGNPSIVEIAEEVKKLGGLHVIGTERHDARRIDNQLRGRSGRQGDPGSTQFFVSLEDDLMRIFGGDKIKGLMTALKIPEDEPIQAGMISGAIESAQEKIEGFNFDARHHLLEYDDVLNKHREIIYKKRASFLNDEPDQMKKIISLRVLDMLWQEHLSYMDHIRDSVRLRAYGGRDPLVEYKNEGHKAFGQLLVTIDANITENIKKAGEQKFQNPMPKFQPNPNSQIQNKNIGRNDECPCGSGKKWKKCGMLNAEEHKRNMTRIK